MIEMKNKERQRIQQGVQTGQTTRKGTTRGAKGGHHEGQQPNMDMVDTAWSTCSLVYKTRSRRADILGLRKILGYEDAKKERRVGEKGGEGEEEAPNTTAEVTTNHAAQRNGRHAATRPGTLSASASVAGHDDADDGLDLTPLDDEKHEMDSDMTDINVEDVTASIRALAPADVVAASGQARSGLGRRASIALISHAAFASVSSLMDAGAAGEEELREKVGIIPPPLIRSATRALLADIVERDTSVDVPQAKQTKATAQAKAQTKKDLSLDVAQELYRLHVVALQHKQDNIQERLRRMTADKVPISDAQRSFLDHISDNGYAAVTVKRVASRAGKAYAYSVGLFYNYEHPEFVVAGLHAQCKTLVALKQVICALSELVIGGQDGVCDGTHILRDLRFGEDTFRDVTVDVKRVIGRGPVGGTQADRLRFAAYSGLLAELPKDEGGDHDHVELGGKAFVLPKLDDFYWTFYDTVASQVPVITVTVVSVEDSLQQQQTKAAEEDAGGRA